MHIFLHCTFKMFKFRNWWHSFILRKNISLVFSNAMRSQKGVIWTALSCSKLTVSVHKFFRILLGKFRSHFNGGRVLTNSHGIKKLWFHSSSAGLGTLVRLHASSSSRYFFQILYEHNAISKYSIELQNSCVCVCVCVCSDNCRSTFDTTKWKKISEPPQKKLSPIGSDSLDPEPDQIY